MSSLTLASSLLSLVDGLDDTNSNGLSHVTDGETTKWGILVVGLNTHWLRRHQLHNASITRLDELGRRLHGLTSSAVDLLDELRELASDVGGVAIQYRGVTGTNLTRVVKDDDLSIERGSLLRGVVLGVRAHVATTNFLDRHVPI